MGACIFVDVYIYMIRIYMHYYAYNLQDVVRKEYQLLCIKKWLYTYPVINQLLRSVLS